MSLMAPRAGDCSGLHQKFAAACDALACIDTTISTLLVRARPMMLPADKPQCGFAVACTVADLPRMPPPTHPLCSMPTQGWMSRVLIFPAACSARAQLCSSSCAA